jgi:hypothetical protein
MLKFQVQARSDKIDIFGLFVVEAGGPTLLAKPMGFEIGKRTTDPEKALITLPVAEARDLAQRILRATGKEGD